MSFSTINTIYSDLHSKHGADYKANGYTSWRMFNIRKKIVLHMIKLIPFQPASFFDAGCGNGFFFKHVVKDLLHDSLRLAHGIDHVLVAAQNAAALFDKTYTGSVLEMTQHTALNYDLVMSNEVFQYIERNQWDRFFHQHTSLVRTGGYLLLTVPNLHSAYRMAIRPPKDMFPVNYYSSDIIILAKKHALSLIRFSGADVLGNIYTDVPVSLKNIISFIFSFLFQKS